MKITWLGHSCFIIKTEKYKIVIDPFDYHRAKIPKISADIVTVSHAHFDHDAVHRIKDKPIILKTTSSFIKDGIKIFSVEGYDDKIGKEAIKNLMFFYEIDGLKIGHQGDLGKPFTKKNYKKIIKSLDILFLRPRIPSVWGMARYMLNTFDAKLIIPIHRWPKGSIKKHENYNLQKSGVDKLIKTVGRVKKIKGHTLYVDKKNIPPKPIVIEFTKVYRGYLK